MSKSILYYTNEQSLNLFQKQRKKELDNEIKQLQKNEAIRNGEFYNEQEVDALVNLYKKTMEKVGIKREPIFLSKEANIKRLIKEKEKEKLLIDMPPILTTSEQVKIGELLPGFDATPDISEKQKPKIKETDLLAKPKITTEMINSILSKFKPIDETKLNNEIKKNAEEFKNNSNNPLNNLLMDELKKKLLTMNEKKKTNEDKLIIKELSYLVVNKMNQVSELEKMAENDKNVESVIEQVLKKTLKDVDTLSEISSNATTMGTSISGQPKSSTLNDQLMQLYDITTTGNNFYKNLKDRLDSIQSVSDKKNNQKKLQEAYQSVLGKSKGWSSKNPKNLNEANAIINKYIELGGEGIKRKKLKKIN